MTTILLERVREAMQKPAAESEFAADPAACKAYGCICRGTVDLGNAGRFLCAWHAWADSDRWPAITAALGEHVWLLTHIAEMERMYARAGAGKPWIATAREFWREQPDMQPTDVECRKWNLYTWRLRVELRFRIGERKEKPEPRKPQCEMPEFKAVRYAGGNDDE